MHVAREMTSRCGIWLIMTSTLQVKQVCLSCYLIPEKACDKNNLEIEYDTSKPDGQYRKDVESDIFNNTFPKFEFTTLKNGIKMTYNKIKGNYPLFRINK